MMKPIKGFILLVVTGVILACGAPGFFNLNKNQNSDETAEPNSSVTFEAAGSSQPADSTEEYQRAMDAFSVDRMLSFLTELTSINAHSGWRGGGTVGESLAFDLVESELANMDWLIAQGMTVERESFHIFVGTLDHTSSVVLTAGEKTAEIPADAPRGSRDNLGLARQMDSDRAVTDNAVNPVVVDGEVVWIPDIAALLDLQDQDLSGKIILADYLLVDSSLDLAVDYDEAARMILDLNPAAVILYTQYSNVDGESHGTFLGDGAGGFQYSEWDERMPLLFIEIENLETLGITSRDELETVTNAEVIWDMDVINPATSSNLIVHIPGKTGGRPILLSAHLDSPNSPGALDDGSGSAIMMEIATVLNEQQISPDVDLYIAWYGSEEILLCGSAYFTTTHSELINQLQGNIQVDALTRPLEGVPAEINLTFSHFITDQLEDDPLARYLQDQAQLLEIDTRLLYYPFYSDNGSMTAFNVSNVDVIYESEMMDEIYGGVWYAGHFHDPYDTVERVAEMKGVFEQMGELVLSAVFIPQEDQDRKNENNKQQALYLANHTEAPHMTAMGFPVFNLALIHAGFEVNVLPYGAELTAKDLEGVDLVIVPPIYDFPVEDGMINGYDTSWSNEETNIINGYAQNGGAVIVANSAYRLKLYNRQADENEDWSALNTLTDQWGVLFTQVGTTFDEISADFNGDNFKLVLSPENAVAFTAPEEAVRAGRSDAAFLAELKVGDGQVFVLADMSALGEDYNGTLNPTLINNLVEMIEE